MPDAEPDGDDPYRLPPDAPAELRHAAKALLAANHECGHLVHQLELWKVLAADREPSTRLGPSEVALAVLSVRNALLTAIVVGIARMVDKSRSGPKKEPLNVIPHFNALLENEAWLRGHREARSGALPVMFINDPPRSDAEVADSVRDSQQRRAERAVAAFDKRMVEFRAAMERFTSGDAGAALERLRTVRNKEVAHHDLGAAWATERPKARDLDLALHALRDLLCAANHLYAGRHVEWLHNERRAKREALCFGAVLRDETAEERAAAAEGAEGGPG